MSCDPPLEEKSLSGCLEKLSGDTPVFTPSQLLEALPGPAWIVECSDFRVLQRNSAAASFSGDTQFLSCFPASLEAESLERLRSPQLRIGFHALPNGERNHWLFSAALLRESLPPQRLILAQPAAVFGVPAELTFDEMLDSAFDGLVILDAERNIVQISARFQQMFGYTTGELRGKSPEVLVPPGSEHEFSSGMERLNGGGIHHLETRRMRRDGTLLEVRVSSQPIASGRFRGGMVVIYRDLTEVNRNACYRNLRMEATRIIATAGSVKQAAQQLLPAVAAELGWDAVRLWQLSENGMECVHAHAPQNFLCSRGPEGRGEKCAINAEQVARGNQSIWISDLIPFDSCPERDACMLRDGVLAAFPIVDAQKQVLGVLN